MQKPDIYIIGSGAIGKALAVFLKQAQESVKLVRGSVDYQPEKEDVITVKGKEDKVFKEEIITTTFSQLNTINGIVLVATKAFANQEIAEKLRGLKGQFSIVLLQNGLNVEEPFYGFDDVYRCVLFATSQVVEENTVSFKMVTESPVGRVNNETGTAGGLIEQISTPHFGFRDEPNILKYVWDKVILNCAFNSICPLLEEDNGIFYRNKEAATLARQVISECVVLAREYEVELDQEEIEEKLLLISERSNGQLISTYEDIRKKRKTEIESLNLEIARMADEIGKPEMVNKTRLLGEMIRLKSEIKCN
ncbi:ketopantoate reductase family protein [Gracilimonas mengyeensis]|uniref:2-dehydropantoate 2-reductase n=1 Tax=Gracilimonas mengyeensis TaxID=1302730 RepID=A0A521FES0_9BACT|nr:2-dehydropantoate 2-reductase [Gracilimonas mengyeensis]SMO94697.1 2-dehydropantoate 2-reductase [Gracilimonas mengyeensis]